MLIPSLAGVLLLASPSHSEELLSSTYLEVKDLTQDLPMPIRIRAERAKLQEPEFKQATAEVAGRLVEFEQIGSAPSDRLSVVKSSDGTLHIADHIAMALWVWQTNAWKCLFSGLHINKTFGGTAPAMHVRYLGKGYFAFAETSPGRTEKKNGPFPQAFAITYLLDSNKERIVERSDAYLYDHNPPLKIDPKWFVKYELPAEPEPTAP